ncbi:MAG: hypothetical protein WCD66_05535 [Rhodanobacteraceae bacterium]
MRKDPHYRAARPRRRYAGRASGGGTWAANQRSGSHNLILGDYNAYSQYGGLVAGNDIVVNGAYASVSGGISNTARIYASSVSGGYNHDASGTNNWRAGSLFESQ